jgi:Arc/MetJ family transcription regulator
MIDRDLVAQVRQILGTKTITETIERALLEVVNRDRREDLVKALSSGDGFDTELIDDAWEGQRDVVVPA